MQLGATTAAAGQVIAVVGQEDPRVIRQTIAQTIGGLVARRGYAVGSVRLVDHFQGVAAAGCTGHITLDGRGFEAGAAAKYRSTGIGAGKAKATSSHAGRSGRTGQQEIPGDQGEGQLCVFIDLGVGGLLASGDAGSEVTDQNSTHDHQPDHQRHHHFDEGQALHAPVTDSGIHKLILK